MKALLVVDVAPVLEDVRTSGVVVEALRSQRNHGRDTNGGADLGTTRDIKN
jgi:hypothetical protein